MIAPWFVLLGAVLLLHVRYALSWKNTVPRLFHSRLYVVVPQNENQKPNWRPIFPADMFVLKDGVFVPKKKTTEEEEAGFSFPPPIANFLEEIANFFSSARYGMVMEEEAKEVVEMKEVETKVNDLMKDLE